MAKNTNNNEKLDTEKKECQNPDYNKTAKYCNEVYRPLEALKYSRYPKSIKYEPFQKKIENCTELNTKKKMKEEREIAFYKSAKKTSEENLKNIEELEEELNKKNKKNREDTYASLEKEKKENLEKFNCLIEKWINDNKVLITELSENPKNLQKDFYTKTKKPKMKNIEDTYVLLEKEGEENKRKIDELMKQWEETLKFKVAFKREGTPSMI